MLPRARPWNSTCRLLASASTLACSSPCRRRAARATGSPAPSRSLLRVVDVLDESDRALVVVHDVVAAQAVAVLVEAVGALDAFVAAGAEDCLADRVRVGALGLIHRVRQHLHRVVGPARVDIRFEVVL